MILLWLQVINLTKKGGFFMGIDVEDKVGYKNFNYNKELINILSDREKIFKEYAYKCNMSQAEHWLLYTIYLGMLSREKYTQKECSELWAFPKQTINSAIKKLINREFIF